MSFYNGNTLLGSFTGNDVIQAGAAFGDPVSAGSNQYVNFFLNGLWFDRIVFSTSTYAFESDNHAFAAVPAPVPVPEPGTLALMGVGMAGLLLTRRRRTANVGI